MSFEDCKKYLSGVNKKGVSTVIAAILTHIVRIVINYK